MENFGFSLLYTRFHNLHIHMIVLVTSVTAMYLTVCSGLYWYYYVKQANKPGEWKCQNKFPERKEVTESIRSGTSCIILSGIYGSFFICYMMNGGYTTAYYEVSDYGFPYLLASFPLQLVYNEMMLYYLHRILHTPFFYKTIHKYHHKFKQPIPFTASSLHPLELILKETVALSPLMLFPIHWGVFFAVHTYIFYYILIEHSGVKWEPLWPWQQNSTFHDKHHELFEVNYGSILTLFDKLHGTHWKAKQRCGTQR